jgi:rare lipoprotein A
VVPSTTTAPAVIPSTTTPAVVPSTTTTPAPQPTEGAAAPSSATATVRYWVQVGYFPDTRSANALANALNSAHHNTNVFFRKVGGVGYHQVLTGPFASKAQAQAAADHLAAEGHPGFVIGK